MKPKTLILMVVAVVCGLGASYMTSRLLAERGEQKAPEVVQITKVKVLSARKPVAIGTYLKEPEKLFVVKEIPSEGAPKDALSELKLLTGKTLKRSLRKDDWIMPEDILDGPLALEPPPGYKALGLRVTVDQTAGGFACVPGSRVDIIWNHRGNGSNVFTKTLLQNVLVLAADNRKDANAEGAAMPAQVVTFAFKPDEANVVSLAAENGTLRLTLRKPGDDRIYEDKDTKVTMKDLIDGRKKFLDPDADEDPWEHLPPIAKADPKTDAKPKVEQPRELPYYEHTITITQGEKQWTEKVKIDRKTGKPWMGDVRRLERPQQQPQVNPQQPAPQNNPQPPAKQD